MASSSGYSDESSLLVVSQYGVALDPAVLGVIYVAPRRWYAHYGENKWAAAKGHLDETTRLAAAPVIEKYANLLADADIFTEGTAFWVMESVRLDLGYGSQVHP